MIGFGFVFFLFLKRGSEERSLTVASQGALLDEATRKKRLRLIRNCRVLVLVLIFFLLNGLWQFGKAPVIALLVGATVNLSMTAGLIYVIVKLQGVSVR